MDFLRLTNLETKSIYIRLSSINAIYPKGNGSKLFIRGDSFPCEVKESPDEILKLIGVSNNTVCDKEEIKGRGTHTVRMG